MNARKRVPNRGRGLPRKALVIMGLAAFIIVDIILAGLALGWGRDEGQTAELDFPAQSASPMGKGEVHVHEAERAPYEEVERERIAPRLLSVVSDTVAWRSEGGTCDERGALELTMDGGETWGAAYPAADELGSPLWVSGADYTTVQSAVAFGSDCELQGVRTFDSGASWTQEDQVLNNSVLVDPNDPSVLIWGGTGLEGPCEDMTQAAVSGGVASAICGNGSIWSLPEDRTQWTQLGVGNAVALSGSEGRWIAAVESRSCNGLGLVDFANESVESLACAPGKPGDAVAVDLTGSSVWLWVEDEVLVSTDSGRSLDG